MVDDATMLQRAIDAANLSAVRFAKEVLGVDDRSVRYWLAGKPMPWSVYVMCWSVVRSPRLALTIAKMLARRRPNDAEG